MQKQFLGFIKKHNLIDEKDKILVAVSGGADSVVLADLFYRNYYDFAIAHCNFHLRGEASDGDEVFVKQMAKNYNTEFFITHFDTKDYVKRNKLSVEMAARELRYNWFNELMQQHGFSLLATGHHANDNVETVLLNLIRGTGIKGLGGIKPRNGNIIRPILFAQKDAILEYCKKRNLTYRIDASNDESEFHRNRIRNIIIPEIKKINPSFVETMSQNIGRFDDANMIYEETVSENLKLCVKQTGGEIRIDIQKFKEHCYFQAYLYEILSPYMFSAGVIEDVFKSQDNNSGKMFYSETHQLLLDREHLVLRPKQIQKPEIVTIYKYTNEIQSPLKLKIDCYDKPKDFKIDTNPKIALLDFDKLKFPLVMRKWKEGDKFKPLGLKGSKKLSDFFIDKKFSVFEKDEIYVLESDMQICWIVGQRIDDRFKISKNTKKIIRFELFV